MSTIKIPHHMSQLFGDGFQTLIPPDAKAGDQVLLITSEDLNPPPGWTKEAAGGGFTYSKTVTAVEPGEWIFFERALP
jgi:hypothetical protein